MPDGLYDRDFVLWSEQQADLLRRLASGERVNEAVDWANLIEEVGDLGASEVRACRSYLAQLIFHLGKLKASPASQAADHWETEIDGFLSQFQNHYAPSMQDRIDLPKIYAQAMGRLTRTPGTSLPALPPDCPFSLDDLLSEDIGITDLLAKLDPPH